MKTLRLTTRKKDQIRREWIQHKLIRRSMHCVGTTDDGLIYECDVCGEKHECIQVDPMGRVMRGAKMLAKYHSQTNSSLKGFCPYCSYDKDK